MQMHAKRSFCVLCLPTRVGSQGRMQCTVDAAKVDAAKLARQAAESSPVSSAGSQACFFPSCAVQNCWLMFLLQA